MNVSIDGNAPLHYMCSWSDRAFPDSLAIVKMLLQHDANIELKDGQGLTPLQRAIAAQRTDIANELLMNHHANPKVVDLNGRPLFHDVCTNAPDLVDRFLLQGADIKCKDRFGKVALSYMAGYGRNDMVLKLLHEGANIEAKDNKGHTPLYHALTNNHFEVCESLVNKNANINTADNEGITLLMASSSPFQAEWLISHKVNVEAKDKDGKTPLMWASETGRLGVMKLILKAGAKINERDKQDRTAIILASSAGKPDIVRELCLIGAEVNTKDRDGKTPLHYAAENGFDEIVKILLDSGADVNAIDKNGKTAFDYAVTSPSLQESLQEVINLSTARPKPTLYSKASRQESDRSNPAEIKDEPKFKRKP